MGKTGKALKRRKLAEATAFATLSPAPGSPDSGDEGEISNNPDFLLGLVSPQELAVSVKTLQTLTSHAEGVKGKAEMKPLRGAVFDFQRVSNAVTGTGNSLPSRISAALSSNRLQDALVLLNECRLRGVHPKLGALQRWVRECDAASRSDGSFGDTHVLTVLDAILRATSGVQVNISEVGKGKGEGVVKRMEDWVLREPSGVSIYSEVVTKTFPAPDQRDKLATSFKLSKHVIFTASYQSGSIYSSPSPFSHPRSPHHPRPRAPPAQPIPRTPLRLGSVDDPSLTFTCHPDPPARRA